MSNITLWGFDGSTYVRTVRMLFAEKNFTDFKQVPLNVLKGEPRAPEHLERHPFGKVPVLDDGDFRILETSAIIRYLNDTLLGKSLIPTTPKDRARMDMAIGLIDSYGYGALLGVAGYYLFPEFIGGKNDTALATGLANSRKTLTLIMAIKGADTFIAGTLSMADLFLAPVIAYLSLTPDFSSLSDIPGLYAWWAAIQALPSFTASAAPHS